MKKEKVGITILILFITITTSINIVSLNKSSKLLGTIPSRNIDSNEVEYTETKTVQGAINDLAEKANIIGTDEEKNKFRDDSKTLIGQIGTDKLNTTSQNLIGAINELNKKYTKTITPLNGSGVIGLYAAGNNVTIKLSNLSPGKITNLTTIATIPEGYRPASEVYFSSSAGYYGILLDSHGNLKISSELSEKTGIYASVSYPAWY